MPTSMNVVIESTTKLSGWYKGRSKLGRGCWKIISEEGISQSHMAGYVETDGEIVA